MNINKFKLADLEDAAPSQRQEENRLENDV